MLLNVEKNGNLDKKRSKQWLVNMDPGLHRHMIML